MVHHRTTKLHAISHYELSHFTEPPHHITLCTKKTMTAAEVAVLTQTLLLLPPPQIFGKIPKYFDTTFWTFFSSSPGQKLHIHADLFSSYVLLGCPTPWFWVIIKRTASRTWCLSMFLLFFDLEVNGNFLITSLF